MAIKAKISGNASNVTLKSRLLQSTGIKAKQVAIGDSTTGGTGNINSISDIADVSATEVDQGILSYNASTDKWETTTIIDGGTF
jgi:lysophospholipase L1-like esterase